MMAESNNPAGEHAEYRGYEIPQRESQMTMTITDPEIAAWQV